MCGIVGYIGNKNAIPILVGGLSTLEYRGYDSAGIAYRKENTFCMVKAVGNLDQLKKKLPKASYSNAGIGHTRWATHGKPSLENAHPHHVGKITLVHNGIIENYETLKNMLVEFGYSFYSDTDSEIACALIDKLYQEKPNMLKVLKQVKTLLQGSYSFVILSSDDPEHIYVMRKDSPLIIATSPDGSMVASDIPAILKVTNQYMILESNEIGVLSATDIEVYNDKLEHVSKKILTYEGSYESATKNGYEHFMLKEIHEQPSKITKLLQAHLSQGLDHLNNCIPKLKQYDRIDIVACGSAYHAGLVGKYFLETLADIPISVEVASEYRYQKNFFNDNTLVVVISQSGETADTLACLRKAVEEGVDTLAIVNVVGSSIAREARYVLYTKMGYEIAVATTKAYSAQVAMLALLAVYFGTKKELIPERELEKLCQDLVFLEEKMETVINQSIYLDLAKKLQKKDSIYFFGRGIDYALSLEGSLKLKEISYIQSFAFQAGELKHGTISLMEQGTPVITVLTDPNIASKTISNMKEVKARGAMVILVTMEGVVPAHDCYDEIIILPKVHFLLQPLFTVLPLQLLAYEVAKLKHCDIDKPRNLAKSVTVE